MLHNAIAQSMLIVAAGFLLGSAMARLFKFNFEFYFGVLIVAATMGGIRLHGETEVAFKAPAHIFVGGLFGAAFRTWFLMGFKSSLKYGLLALTLTLLETYCALASRKLI